MSMKLKGSVSYYTYIWHANPNACDRCLQMDGKIFENIDDIPDLLHPNCQCWVDAVDCNEKENQNDFENNRKDEIETLIGDAKSLKDEVNAALDRMGELWGQDSDWQIKTLINSYASDLNNADSILISFLDELYNLSARENVFEADIKIMQNRYFEYENYYQNILKYFDKEIERAEKNKESDFSKDIKKYTELKEIMDYCHGNKQSLPDGYKEIEKIHDKETALDVQIFTKDDEVVMSFPGSVQVPDFLQDVNDIPRKKINPQVEKAQEVLDEIKNNPNLHDKKIVLSGYSLGGNTASQLGALNDIDTVTFESYYGIGAMIQKKADENNKVIEIHPEKIINYYHQNDLVKEFKKEGHLGNTYETYGNIPTNNSISAVLKNEFDNKVFPHGLGNLGNSFERSPEPIHINIRTFYFPKPNQ